MIFVILFSRFPLNESCFWGGLKFCIVGIFEVLGKMTWNNIWWWLAAKRNVPGRATWNNDKSSDVETKVAIIMYRLELANYHKLNGCKLISCFIFAADINSRVKMKWFTLAIVYGYDVGSWCEILIFRRIHNFFIMGLPNLLWMFFRFTMALRDCCGYSELSVTLMNLNGPGYVFIGFD